MRYRRRRKASSNRPIFTKARVNPENPHRPGPLADCFCNLHTIGPVHVSTQAVTAKCVVVDCTCLPTAASTHGLAYPPHGHDQHAPLRRAPMKMPFLVSAESGLAHAGRVRPYRATSCIVGAIELTWSCSRACEQGVRLHRGPHVPHPWLRPTNAVCQHHNQPCTSETAGRAIQLATSRGGSARDAH